MCEHTNILLRMENKSARVGSEKRFYLSASSSLRTCHRPMSTAAFSAPHTLSRRSPRIRPCRGLTQVPHRTRMGQGKCRARRRELKRQKHITWWHHQKIICDLAQNHLPRGWHTHTHTHQITTQDTSPAAKTKQPCVNIQTSCTRKKV